MRRGSILLLLLLALPGPRAVFLLEAESPGADSELSFQVKPSGLSLAPDFKAAAELRARHGALRPHWSLEARFRLRGAALAVDMATLRRIIAELPALAEEGDPAKRPFRSVSVLGSPLETGDFASFALRFDDSGVGPVVFDALAVRGDGWFLFRLTNAEPVRYKFFPAVKSGNILVDLVYVPGADGAESSAYLVWSIRGPAFLPGAGPSIEEPLRLRTALLKDWFLRRLEGERK